MYEIFALITVFGGVGLFLASIRIVVDSACKHQGPTRDPWIGI